jgi:ribosomal protein L37E
MKRDYAEHPPGTKAHIVRCAACGAALHENDVTCAECGAARKPKMAERMETK